MLHYLCFSHEYSCDLSMLIYSFKIKTKTQSSHSSKVFPLCRCLTLKPELQHSAWYELHVAFFMLANWVMLTGFEVKENILINQLISCISSFSQQTVIKNAVHHLNQDWVYVGMMSTDIDTLRDLLLWYVHLCLWAEAGQHDALWFTKLSLL